MDEPTKWPTASILGYGSFGWKTPAGRRYHIRTGIALAVVFFLWPVSFFFQLAEGWPWARFLAAIVPGACYGYIAWEARRYWLTLDELARRIMLESAAWTYLLAIAIGSLVGGISFIFWDARWTWVWSNPIWVLLLEPVRGAILYYLAKRY